MGRGLRQIAGFAVVAAMLVAPASASALTEGFGGGVPATWEDWNNSDPLGIGYWRQGDADDLGFGAQAGGANSFVGVDYQSVDDVGTISDWMITAPIDGISNGDTWSFYTRTLPGSDYPDRLQFRLSTDECYPGLTADGVGDFDILLKDVNPDLEVGGYPESWTKMSGVVTGVPAPVTGCFGFRYFVTDGGETGDNSNIIVVDTFAFDDGGSEPEPPDPPVITGTEPGSPAQDIHPEVFGSGAGNTDAVDLYADPTCSGAPIGSGDGSDFTGDGITATVPAGQTTAIRATVTDDASGLISDCSAPYDYTESSGSGPGPTPPAGTGDHTPPDTTIVKGPKRKTKKKRAKFTLSATEPGSFACTLDGAPVPCSADFSVKVKRSGTHELSVAALDAAGNADPTPATYSWKLKRSKKKR